MSEPETETPDTETPDTETPTPTPAPDEEEADDEEARRAEEEAIARVKAASSAEIPKKIERAVTDQRRRLEKIIGVELEGSECPTCGGMGYTVGGSDPDAALVHPENLVMCEACNGWGAVETGSRNPDHITAVCIKCSGNGFVTLPTVTPLPQAAPAALPTAQAAQMGQLLPDGSFLPFGASEPIRVNQAG